MTGGIFIHDEVGLNKIHDKMKNC